MVQIQVFEITAPHSKTVEWYEISSKHDENEKEKYVNLLIKQYF
jgi:hypothetical protein